MKKDMTCNRTLYFTDEFYDQLKKKAAENGLSVSSYIRMVMLKEWGCKNGKKI